MKESLYIDTNTMKQINWKFPYGKASGSIKTYRCSTKKNKDIIKNDDDDDGDDDDDYDDNFWAQKGPKMAPKKGSKTAQKPTQKLNLT